MKLKLILTELSDIVNEKLFLTILIVILTATLFYMIGWISCSMQESKPLEIEDFSKNNKIGYF